MVNVFPKMTIVKDDYVFKDFWYIYNLNNDFISLELITLERESTKEAKLFDKNNVSKTNGKGLENETSFITD